MDIISRLKRFIDTHQIPVTQFADNCRIPRPTLSQLLNGRNKKVSDEVISKIHEAYPSLSMLWLMFGEGKMESGASGQSSDSQISLFDVAADTQPTDIAPHIDFVGDFTENTPEKAARPSQPNYPPKIARESPAETSSATITFGSDRAGKRVISIVVYYDDNSYESFVPDPTGRSPFAR